MPDDPSDEPRWHEALAYAVVGARLEGLGRQAHPDVAALATVLEARPELASVRPGSVARHAVPPELLTGIGPAQFWAVLAELRAELARRVPTPPAPVTSSRPLTAEERRLLAEVPPHHGH